MEAPLNRILLTVIGLALTGAVIGLIWTMYSGMTKTVDFTVSNLQVFKSGSYWRVMFKIKNTGTLKIDGIYVYLYRGTSNIASWSTSQDVGVGNEVFIDSGWIYDPDPQHGESLKCIIRVVAYGGSEAKKVFDVVVLPW